LSLVKQTELIRGGRGKEKEQEKEEMITDGAAPSEN